MSTNSFGTGNRIYAMAWYGFGLAIVCCASAIVSVGRAADVGPAEILDIQIISPITGRQVISSETLLSERSQQQISIDACRGEYEPASFVLRANKQAVTDVLIEASDLLDTVSGRTISKSAIDIRVVKVWFQGSSAWVDILKKNPQDYQQVMVPELLLKDDALVNVDIRGHKNLVKVLVDNRPQYVYVNQERLLPSAPMSGSKEFLVADDADNLKPFTIDASAVKQIWVTVHVPPDSHSGYYTGKLTISAAGSPAQEVQLRLRVLPFDLSPSRVSYSIYYRAQLGKMARSRNGGSEYRTVQQMSADLSDMQAHGVTNPTMYQSSFDLEEVDAALGVRKDMKLSGSGIPLLYIGMQTTETYLGSTAMSSQKALTFLLPMIAEKAKAAGFSTTFIYGRDEASGRALQAQRTLWTRVHQVGSRVFVAGSTGAYPLVGDVLDLFVHYGKPSAAEAAQWHSQNKKLFNYANPQSGPENPYLFRLNYGVMLWAHGYDGAMPYAYQHCFGSCWNDVDHPKYRDHMFTYPTISGVISTLAWEGFREAVDDTRYISTLESLIGDGAESNRSDKRRARATLDRLRIYLQSTQSESGLYNHDADIDLDEIRGRVRSHILEIVENNHM